MAKLRLGGMRRLTRCALVKRDPRAFELVPGCHTGTGRESRLFMGLLQPTPQWRELIENFYGRGAMSGFPQACRFCRCGHDGQTRSQVDLIFVWQSENLAG